MGTTVIDIPGGQAALRDPGEMTVRQRNALLASIMTMPLNVRHNIEKLDEIEVSDHDVETLFRLNRTAAWALLESWTIDRPLPKLDEVDDLPASLVDALMKGVSPILARMLFADKFGPDGAPDPDSPTGP